MAPYVAGKTGTTDDENDAWFVGFSNDVTIAVWVGYDNADGYRRTLGTGRTGGNVAIPIFEPIMKAVWEHYAPKEALRPPSPEARRHLAVRQEEQRSSRAGKAAMLPEYLRRDDRGRTVDARYRLLSRKDRETQASAQASKRRLRPAQEEPQPTYEVRRDAPWFGGQGFFGWQRSPNEGKNDPWRGGRGF